MKSSKSSVVGVHLFLRAIALASVSPMAFIASAHAQTVERGTVDGTVTTAESQIQLQGAIVEIPALGMFETTDRYGRFIFRSVPVGDYEVIVSYEGRQDIRKTVTVDAGSSATLPMQMVGIGAVGDEDSIVVTGSPISFAESAALSRQKAADNLILVIAPDMLGNFPDQNVAASLARLPGVSVERDQGQERYVNLRGAPSKWTTISFDGVGVVSPQGRKARLDTIPNSLVGSIVLTKAITPDMPGDTIAGNVNIITRSPFDRDGFTVVGNLGLGFREHGGKLQHDYSLSVSDTFANDTFGYLVSGSYYEYSAAGDTTYQNQFEFAAEDTTEGSEDRLWSRGAEFRSYHRTRKNQSLAGRLEWRPDADNQVFIQSIYTSFDDFENRDQYYFDFDDDISGGCYASIKCGNSPLSGTIHGVELQATFNTNHYINNIWTNTIGGKHTVGGWDLSWTGNYTKANNEFYAPSRYSFASPDDAARPSVTYDYTNPDNPVVIPYSTVTNADGSYSLGNRWQSIGSDDYRFTQGLFWDDKLPTNAWVGNIDVERQSSLFGMPTEFKFGISGATRSKSRDDYMWYITPNSLAEAGSQAPTINDFVSDRPWDGKFPIFWASQLYDPDKANALFDKLDNEGAMYLSPTAYDSYWYKVRETVAAGYAMATTRFTGGSVVAGLRVERQWNSGTANGKIAGYEGPIGRGYLPFSVDSARTDFFPSLHVNFDLNADQKLRFSLNTGISRPDFDTRAPNFRVNDTAQTISGGNPYALPERTYGADISYEWYLRPVGILSVGAFYKRIVDPLMTAKRPEFGSDQLNDAMFDRSGYAFSTTGNGSSGHYAGLEIAYSQKFDFLPDWGLPNWSDGFGFTGNVTLVDSKMVLENGREADVPGASELTYNTSLYWEKHGLSLRTNWQWRTKYLASHSSSDERLDTYFAGTGRLSAGARYQVNEGFEIYVDANNLTNQIDRQLYKDREHPLRVELLGRSYMAGVRFNF